MAVSSVYAVAVQSQFSAFFANGEQGLSVNPTIGTTAPRSTYHLAKWIDLKGGIYTLKSLSVDGALWSVGTSPQDGRVIQNVIKDEGVLVTEVYLPTGRHRFDIILSHLGISTGVCYVAFSLWQDNRPVYVSSTSGWVFDTSPIPNSAIPALGDYRLTLPLFSVRPNWANGVTERIDYKTEVLSSESDVEQRRSIRRFPRRSFEASFSRHDVRRARLNNFMTGVGNNEVLVPLWHEQYTVKTQLGTQVDFPAGTLEMREFRQGDLVWVNSGDPAVSEVLTVGSVDLVNSKVSFTAAPVDTWPSGSTITPLRVARMLDAPQMDNLSDRVGMVQARFSLSDTESWPDPTWGYCAPLFRFPINRAIPVNSSYERPTAYLLDNDYGPVDVQDFYSTTRVSVRCGLTIRGRANLFDFRQFIAMARGRAVRFWMPSMTQDMQPLGDFGGSYVDMRDAGFAEYMARAQEARVMVAVIFKDGRPNVYRKIDFVQRVTGGERVYFTRQMPTVSLSDVERLMFIIPARFDQDGFEIQHLVDDSGVAQTQVIVKSSNADDLPDIECITTSRPYALDPWEGIGVAVAITEMRLFEFRYLPEGLNSGALLTGGILDEVMLATRMPNEGVNAQAQIIGGYLGVALVNYTNYTAEATTVTVSVVAGSLANLLITNTIRAEGVNVTSSIVGGTLI